MVKRSPVVVPLAVLIFSGFSNRFDHRSVLKANVDAPIETILFTGFQSTNVQD